MPIRLVPAGAKIFNPLNRQTFIFTKPAEDEAFAEFDVLLHEGGASDVKDTAHIHPRSDEHFTVRSGLLRVVIDGKEHMVGPGETVTVPRGAPHFFRTGHDGETLMTQRFEPGMKFLRFFLNFAVGPVSHPEWFGEDGKAPLLLAALAFDAFPNHVYVDGPPVWAQKALFTALAPIARMKGYYLPFEAEGSLCMARTQSILGSA